MADESVPKLILEIIWTLIRVFCEICLAIYKVFIPNEPKSVKGEIVLITGSAHGLGREQASRYGKLGAVVVCVDINTKGNEETAEIINKNKGKAFAYTCNVTDRAAYLAMADKVRKDVGDVTILVNNAGIMPCKPLLNHSEKEIRLMTDINFHSYLWGIQTFLPSMLEKNHGHIVSISSAAGITPAANLVPYCGSKYAVRGFMDALRVELHSSPVDTTGIKFTTICPTATNTGLCQNPIYRFSIFKPLETVDCVDYIMDAVLREKDIISILPNVHYLIRYILNPLPFKARQLLLDLVKTGVGAHEKEIFEDQ